MYMHAIILCKIIYTVSYLGTVWMFSNCCYNVCFVGSGDVHVCILLFFVIILCLVLTMSDIPEILLIRCTYVYDNKYVIKVKSMMPTCTSPHSLYTSGTARHAERDIKLYNQSVHLWTCLMPASYWWPLMTSGGTGSGNSISYTFIKPEGTNEFIDLCAVTASLISATMEKMAKKGENKAKILTQLVWYGIDRGWY